MALPLLPSAPRRDARRCVISALLLAIVLGAGPGARAQAQEFGSVDAALVVVLDASWSIDNAEYRLQRDGMAAAFRSRAVLETIRNGPNGAVAVTVVQSAGPGDQVVGVPWMRIADAAGAARVAARIAAMERRVSGGPTAIGSALEFARGLVATCPCRPDRRVVDYAGDGRNNRSDLARAREALAADGVTVNGLAILSEVPTLREYFELRMIVGRNAFAEAAETVADFPPAFRRKLIRELGGMAAAGSEAGDGQAGFSAIRNRAWPRAGSQSSTRRKPAAVRLARRAS
jgi:hypothetical protein